ncbi:Tropomyosin beta chain [Plecturocebus cupreus]
MLGCPSPTVTMDTINKKMQTLTVEKDNVTNLIEQAEANEKQSEDCYKQLAEEQQGLQKNLKGTEDDMEEYLEFMKDILEKLEQEEKDTIAQANVVSIKCLIQQIEDELDWAEKHLAAALKKLDDTEKLANENDRKMKFIKYQVMKYEEKIWGGKLDHSGEIAEVTNIQARQLEENLHDMDQNIKALRVLAKEYSMKMCTFAEDMELAEEKLKAVETQEEFIQRSLAKLGEAINKLEKTMTRPKEKNMETRQTLN